MATIAICIPVYNQCRTIKETIEAALSQNKKASEIIVSDNFSNDGTSKVIEFYRDRLSIISPPSHCIATDNFNFAVNSCKSEWIAICSGDDILLPNYIEEVSKCIGNSKDAVFVMGGWENYNEALQTSQPHHLLSMRRVTKPPKTIELQLLGPKASFSSFCFRKDVFIKIGGFDCDYKVIQDWMFQFDISKFGSVLKVNDLISKYRISSRLELETERLPQYAQDRLLYLDSKIWEAIDFGVPRKKVLIASRKVYIEVLNYLHEYSLNLDIQYLERMNSIARKIDCVKELEKFKTGQWIVTRNKAKILKKFAQLFRKMYNKVR